MSDPAQPFSWVTLIAQLGIPALVAAGVTFFLNRRLERLKGQREINSRIFDSARDNVRDFAKLTSAYWLRDRSERDAEDETSIMLVQSDVLVDVAAVLSLVLEEHKAEIETALDELVRFGTGGDFQSADRKSDIARAQKMPGAAARLRNALIGARRALLQKKNH